MNSTRVYEEKNIANIHSAMQAVMNRVDGFAKTK